MAHCKVCNANDARNYCPDCGSPATLKRINGHYLVHEVEHVLHFERGILYTIKELLLRPGINIRKFFLEDRSRLVKPVIFIIITSLLYSIITHLFHIEPAENLYRSPDSTANKISNWTTAHLGYANLIMGALIAVFVRLFFRKYEFNYFEILIMLCFVMGFGMLIFAVFSLLQGIIHINLQPAAAIVSILYATWAIGNFFNQAKTMSYVKAFSAYILGMISFSLLIELIGNAIDWVII